MILLDNLILLIVLTALFAAASYLSLTMKQKKLIPAVVSAVIELGTVVLLLFKGASIEELFLMILVFGCITLSLNYYAKRENTDASAGVDEKTE